jgi:hypothetical protein
VYIKSAASWMNDFHTHLPRAVTGSRGKEGKLRYVFTPDGVSQFVVPLCGRTQTLSRVLNPSAFTLSTGDTYPHFHALLRPQKGHAELYRKRSGPGLQPAPEVAVCRSVSDTALVLLGHKKNILL